MRHALSSNTQQLTTDKQCFCPPCSRRFVDSGFAADLVQLLQHKELTSEAAAACAGALRSFTTADDERPPASKAFVHARVLAKNSKALQALLQALNSTASNSSSGSKTAIALLDAVRQVRDAGWFLRWGRGGNKQGFLQNLVRGREICKGSRGKAQVGTSSSGSKTAIALLEAIRGDERHWVIPKMGWECK